MLQQICAIVLIAAALPLAVCKAQEAQEAQEATSAAESTSPRQLYQHAAELIAASKYQQAITPLQQLIELHAGTDYAQTAEVHLAECHLLSGNPQRCFELLDARQAGDDARTEARVKLLRLHACCRIATSFEKAGESEPTLTWLNRGLALIDNRHKDFNQLNSALIRVAVQACLEQIAHQRDPAEFLTQLATQNPHGPQQALSIRFALAERLMAERKYASALPYYEFLADHVARQPAPPAWAAAVALRRCELYTHLKQYPQAYEIREHAKTAFSDFPSLHQFDFLAARCAIAQIEFEQAIDDLKQVIQAAHVDGPDKAQAQWMIGEVYFLQRKFEEALLAYDAVKQYECPHWESRALMQRGKCLELSGRGEEALSTYQDLAKRYAATPEGKSAEQRIATLKQPSNR